MRRRVTIEVDVSCSEQLDDEQMDKFLASEFCGCPIECEEYDKLVENIDYRVLSYMVED